MSRKQTRAERGLRDWMAGSLDTMNMITMFWLTCREAEVWEPDLKFVWAHAQKAHGRPRKPHSVAT